MAYAYSTDQIVILDYFDNLPSDHWVQDTADAGHYEPVDVGNAASWGYYPIDDTPARPADQPTTTWDDSYVFTAGTFVLTWTERTLTAEEQTARDDALDRSTKRTNVGAQVATLRAWAADAQSTNVTNGNNNAVTQTMVDRLGLFFDRFADTIEALRWDQ